MPIFPELRPLLDAAWVQAADGAEFVIARRRDSNINLRTQLLRIIDKAGLTSWPKLFQNLRSTRGTELTETFPLHVVTAWLGNSQLIAAKHYLQVTNSHFHEETQNPTQKGTEMSETDGKPVIRRLSDNENTPDFPGHFVPFSSLHKNEYPRQGLNMPLDSRGKSMIGVQDDALSDARLIELVEAWAGLPDGVKDRIAEMVASIVGSARGA